MREQDAWDAVRELNRAWAIDRDVSRLRRWFHRDMVAITPGDRLRLEGQEACLAAWQAFVDAVRVLRWEEREPDVRLFAGGRVAVVTYYYEAMIERGGVTETVSGRDMMTLVDEDGRCLVVADHFSGFPGARG